MEHWKLYVNTKSYALLDARSHGKAPFGLPQCLDGFMMFSRSAESRSKNPVSLRCELHIEQILGKLNRDRIEEIRKSEPVKRKSSSEAGREQIFKYLVEHRYELSIMYIDIDDRTLHNHVQKPRSIIPMQRRPI